MVLRGMSSKIFLHFSGKLVCPLSDINLPIGRRSRLWRAYKELLFYGQEIFLYSCVGILQISGPEIQVLKIPPPSNSKDMRARRDRQEVQPQLPLLCRHISSVPTVSRVGCRSAPDRIADGVLQ